MLNTSNVKKLYIISFLRGLYFHTAILTLFFIQHGLNVEALIIANTIWSISNLLTEVPTGYIADRFGQKTSIIIGYTLDALGTILLVLLPTKAILYSAYFIKGIGGSFESGSQEALLYESAKSEAVEQSFSKIYGQSQANERIGFAISTIIAGLLVHYSGSSFYNLLFIATGITSGIAILLALSLKSLKSKNIKNNPKVIQSSFGFILKNKTTRVLTLFGMLTLSGAYFLRSVYQPYFESAEISPIFLGFTIGFGSLINFWIFRNIYRLEKYLEFQNIALLITVTMGIVYVLLGTSKNPLVLILGVIILFGIFDAQLPLVSKYLNDRISSENRTTTLSMISFIQQIANIGIKLLLAAVVSNWSIEQALILNGIYLICGILISYYLINRCGCLYNIEENLM